MAAYIATWHTICTRQQAKAASLISDGACWIQEFCMHTSKQIGH